MGNQDSYCAILMRECIMYFEKCVFFFHILSLCSYYLSCIHHQLSERAWNFLKRREYILLLLTDELEFAVTFTRF